MSKTNFEINDPYYDLMDLNQLIIRAARRCAYDLGHASSALNTEEMREQLYQNHIYYLGIFNPANMGKDYRSRLHQEIWMLETKLDKMKKLCDNAGVDYSEVFYDDIPF